MVLPVPGDLGELHYSEFSLLYLQNRDAIPFLPGFLFGIKYCVEITLVPLSA